MEWLNALQVSCSCICQIGDHHVSLWMMPHKNFEHCGRMYIDFLFFVTLFYVLVLGQLGDSITYLLFMVRAMVSTLMLGVPWQHCVGSKSCPNFSLHMACVESMALVFHGKNQGFKG